MRFDGKLEGCVWHGVGYDGGPYTGGPFRVVLHTTEGDTAEGALAIFLTHYASHFVIDGSAIYQLIDTGVSAKALQHIGDPQTNRLSCVQIEMVGFAERTKDRAVLSNTRRLLRALEAAHGIPRVWPNGHCVPPVNGQDSGHHNRNALTWATRGGYYGHEHVPENFHWDPALSDEETNYLMADDVQPVHPEPPSGKTYTVVAGDDLFKIGQRFGITPAKLAAINQIPAPFVIQVGQVLKLGE